MERRRLLLVAAYDLLCERPIEEVGFRDIAERAGIREGSAYHFFANRFDVFTALANELSSVFVARHRRKIPAAKRRRWQDLAEYMVDVGASVYAENPPARQLLIGSKTPPEVKHADRINDRTVARVMHEVFVSCFDVPRTTQMRSAFYYFIEITDVIFTLSIIEHGRITRAMLVEAKRAGTGYLGTYLGH